ncbi:amidohydrolase [Rhodobacteraceae bacterium F11138]|nr:amidohydrolase [Rhodobacteraceae bacterium F11138]
MPIKNRFNELLPEMTAWRRDFHANPELLYDTHRTAGIVAQKLREFGCDEVVEGIGRTGVVGVIKGRTSGPRTVGLRADMDALPIREATGLAHASKIDGLMHACGHDGHTAMLLGAAKYLAETRNFAGTVVVIFQPAEEGGAGALAMCKDGLMDRWKIDEVYALHNGPKMRIGQFGIRQGPLLAAGDVFDIQIRGFGGHAAQPHRSVDTMLVAAMIIVGLQAIVSRNSDPNHALVVSVTQLTSDSDAVNVIPETVTLQGTARALDRHEQDMAEARIKETAVGIAAAYGATAEVVYTRKYPLLENSAEQTEAAIEAALEVSGDFVEQGPSMGSEDFAFMLQERPGAFMRVGNGDSAPLHNPAYEFNDEAMPFGSSWFVRVIENRMPIEP